MPAPDLMPEQRRALLADPASPPPPSTKHMNDMTDAERADFMRWAGRPQSPDELRLRQRRLRAAQFYY